MCIGDAKPLRHARGHSIVLIMTKERYTHTQIAHYIEEFFV